MMHVDSRLASRVQTWKKTGDTAILIHHFAGELRDFPKEIVVVLDYFQDDRYTLVNLVYDDLEQPHKTAEPTTATGLEEKATTATGLEENVQGLSLSPSAQGTRFGPGLESLSHHFKSLR